MREENEWMREPGRGGTGFFGYPVCYFCSSAVVVGFFASVNPADHSAGSQRIRRFHWMREEDTWMREPGQ